MIEILPSIASADMLSIQRTLDRLGNDGRLHLDMEDGNFIPNITFGMKTIRAISAYSGLSLNAHLMVTNPMLYIDDLAACGVKELSVHIEALPYPLEVLTYIRSKGMKAGLALNFITPVSVVEPFAEALDFLLIMTSEPDGGDQTFRASSLKRIAEARALLDPSVSIWVDGGIGEAQLPQVVAAGADTVVMGRAVVGHEDPKERIRYFTDMANNEPKTEE